MKKICVILVICTVFSLASAASAERIISTPNFGSPAAPDTVAADPSAMASFSPVRVLTYRDEAHTEPITDSFAPGEKVYYQIDCDNGYFADTISINDAKYIDGECFILGDEPWESTVKIY